MEVDPPAVLNKSFTSSSGANGTTSLGPTFKDTTTNSGTTDTW